MYKLIDPASDYISHLESVAQNIRSAENELRVASHDLDSSRHESLRSGDLHLVQELQELREEAQIAQPQQAASPAPQSEQAPSELQGLHDSRKINPKRIGRLFEDSLKGDRDETASKGSDEARSAIAKGSCITASTGTQTVGSIPTGIATVEEKIGTLCPLLTEIVKRVPRRSIRIIYFDTLSVIDECKAFIEDRTGFEWDWWPLHPRKWRIEPGTARLEWNCAGHVCYDIIPVAGAEAVVEILRKMEDHPMTQYGQQSRGQSVGLLQRLKAIFRSRADSSSDGESSCSTPPSSVSSSASVKYTPSQETQRNRNQSGDSTRIQTQDQELNSPEGHQKGPWWLLFGVQGRRQTLELENLFIPVKMKDLELFTLLKAVHTKHRGWMRTWISPFRFQKCRFVKFQVHGNRVLTAEKEDLPDDYGRAQEYEYTPRPPQAKILLINSNEFKLYLSACFAKCEASVLPFFDWHDCFVPLPKSKMLDRIPKKISPLDVSSD